MGHKSLGGITYCSMEYVIIGDIALIKPDSLRILSHHELKLKLSHHIIE